MRANNVDKLYTLIINHQKEDFSVDAWQLIVKATTFQSVNMLHLNADLNSPPAV